jgi:selenide,water dikinase
MPTEIYRLTELASCAGCAGKAGAALLADVLSRFPELQNSAPDLLVGLDAPDDAAVYRLNEQQAIVATVDFFGPLVDDAYDYGAIAAANALSDVYAMGADALLALNVSAFPDDLPIETIAAVLRGGADKVREAGAIIAGGHTIRDAEPKYGLCVLGIVHPERIITKGGARPGDLLFLTKPLGTGIIATAAMRDRATPDDLAAAVASMVRLNKEASHIARDVGVHAMTDVTGFSLLGHACEMSSAGGVGLRINATDLPLLPGALDYAAAGITTGGAARNREHFAARVRIDRDIDENVQNVLWDPQTSGGLLMAVPLEDADALTERFAESGAQAWSVGVVVPGQGVELTA